MKKVIKKTKKVKVEKPVEEPMIEVEVPVVEFSKEADLTIKPSEMVISEEIITPEPSVCDVQKIIINGKTITRLNDGKDTPTEFHCSVDNGETGHFNKTLFQ